MIRTTVEDKTQPLINCHAQFYKHFMSCSFQLYSQQSAVLPFCIVLPQCYSIVELGERGRLVVESLTPQREVGVGNLPPPCCVLEQDTLTPKKVLAYR